MGGGVEAAVDSFMSGLEGRTPGETEFHQAAREVVESLMPVVLDREDYRRAKILERITEPDRVVSFRVVWECDRGDIHVNRGYRVQFSNAIGPYKGGLRFHPTVNQSVLKFLGFEQIFKNSLTGLPLGAGKGGADFDPKGRSDREVMRFCKALMRELWRYIGDDVDVPAGDIGVGAREIGFLYGEYKRLSGRVTGVLTGKALDFGGSEIRKEATGYGTVYFTQEMLERAGDGLEGKDVVISGSGNVAIYAAEKCLHVGARVVAMSDSDGVVHDPEGIDEEKLAFVKELKEVRRGRIREYAEKYRSATFREGVEPWGINCDVALPCATQNELDQSEAKALVANGVIAVAEGANMPCTAGAVAVFKRQKILFGPGKAANAGGVAVSGLEMSQNALRLSWSREEVDEKLKGIMRNIHAACAKHGEEESRVNYVKGANVAGFLKVADAMLAYGVM